MSGNAVVLAHREKHEILDRQDIFQASLCPTVTFSQFIEAATEDAQPGRVFCLAQNTERRKGCLGLQKQSQHAPQGLSRMRLGVRGSRRASEDAQPGRVFCLVQNTERRKGCLGLQKQSQHAPQGLSRMRLGVKSVAPCGIEPQPSEPESEILSIKL